MINLVIALLSEARPLINHYQLKQTEKEPYSIYENDQMRLVLSGIGKLNAACAVTSLIHLRPITQDECWLNIGLAGHPSYPLGSACLVSKVSDWTLRRVFYPAFTFEAPGNRAPLISLDQPSQNYLEDTLYDMEAFGYYFAAIKYVLSEKIHSYKIISDNKKNPFHQITKEKTEHYITNHIEPIDKLIQSLKQLTPNLKPHPETSSFLNHWRFSETQKHRLKRALNVLFLHHPEKASFCGLNSISCPKELLTILNTNLQKVPL
ncbi:MAG: hypothetical protein S4CHLAM7_09490 [Chlamydiae bacterium]|nr:hypothetical protein [Chlamydiota bacterium]